MRKGFKQLGIVGGALAFLILLIPLAMAADLPVGVSFLAFLIGSGVFAAAFLSAGEPDPEYQRQSAPRRRTPQRLGSGPFPAVEKAERDRAAGELWKARERLGSLCAAAPANQAALQLLGQVYFEMRDLPNAGRYWFLTDAEGEKVDEAVRALKAKYRFPEILTQIPARAPIAEYPPAVQARLRELQEQAAASGRTWAPWETRSDAVSSTGSQRVTDTLAIGVAMVLGPGIWLLGVVAAIAILVELF